MKDEKPSPRHTNLIKRPEETSTIQEGLHKRNKKTYTSITSPEAQR